MPVLLHVEADLNLTAWLHELLLNEKMATTPAEGTEVRSRKHSSENEDNGSVLIDYSYSLKPQIQSIRSNAVISNHPHRNTQPYGCFQE